jgi:hypothetical protein
MRLRHLRGIKHVPVRFRELAGAVRLRKTYLEKKRPPIRLVQKLDCFRDDAIAELRFERKGSGLLCYAHMQCFDPGVEACAKECKAFHFGLGPYCLILTGRLSILVFRGDSSGPSRSETK